MRQLPDDPGQYTRSDKIYILHQYRWYINKITADIDRLAKQNARIYSPGAIMLTREPKGGKSLDIGDRIANRDDLDDRIRVKEKEADSIKAWMEECIKTIGDPQLELLISYRYLDGLSLIETAAMMDYSYSRAKDLHADAIDRITISVKDRP